MLLFPLSTFRMVCSGAFTWSKLARTGARRTINSITVSLLKLILLCTYTSIMEHVLRNLVLVTECQFLLHCLTFFLNNNAFDFESGTICNQPRRGGQLAAGGSPPLALGRTKRLASQHRQLSPKQGHNQRRRITDPQETR